MSQIAQQIKKGAGWMVLFKCFDRVSGLVSMIILARLLTPADFGLVAMASAVVAFMALFGAFGFDIALIQNQSARRSHYDTAWTFKVLVGAFSAVGIILLAVPVATLYGEPRLVSVFCVLALGPFVMGLENIGVVAFRKELTFDREFRFLAGKRLASFFVTVSLAVIFRTYWALVAGVVVGQFVGVVLSYLLHPFRPRFSLAARSELFNFSKWLLLNNFVSFFYLRSADLIIGSVAGARSLGLYRISDGISSIPRTELIAPVNRAVFPGYAKVSADRTALRRGFLKVISIIAMIALPAAAGIAVTSEFLVCILLGDQWLAAVPLIQILAFHGAITALGSNTYCIHLALQSARTFATLKGASVLVLIPLIIVLTGMMGAIGAALSQLIVAILFFPLFYRAVMHKLDLRVRPLVRELWRPVTAATVMYVIVWQATTFMSVDYTLEDLLEFGSLVTLGACSYCLVLLSLWHFSGRPDGPEKMVLNNLSFIERKLGAQSTTSNLLSARHNRSQTTSGIVSDLDQ